MANLSEIMKTVVEKKKLAAMEVPENSPIAAGALARKKRAQEEIKTTYISYRKAAMGASVYVVFTGQKAKEAANSASEFDMAVMSSSVMAESIVSKMSPALYMNKTMSPAIIDIVASIFEDMAIELDIVSYPVLHYKSNMAINISSEEQMVKLVHMFLQKELGEEIFAIDYTDRAAREAYENEFDGPVVPMAIYEEDAQAAENLVNKLRSAGKKAFLVSTNEESENELLLKEINKKELGSVLQQIKSQLK